jgi:hypothetical protein
MALSRGICPRCGRSIALDDRNQLWDHNSSPNGGGALFATKRAIGTDFGGQKPLCPGSGKYALAHP